jgi:magnesium transporter
MNVKVIHTKNLRWIDIINAGPEDIAYLQKNFNFHPLDLEDIRETSQHPKVEDREIYHFIVLLFAVSEPKKGIVRPGEVDIFIGKDYVITLHDGSMYTLLNLFKSVQENDEVRKVVMSKNPGYLLYQILEPLFKRHFPLLDKITKEMDDIEKTIFDNLTLQMLERISLTKRNIIDFRRIMKTHHLIVKRLMSKRQPYLVFPDSKNYYANILEHAENIWDILAIQKETIEALQDANQSLATNRLNDISKVITVFPAVFLPATLITFIFSLGVDDLPLQHNPHGFFIIIGLAALSSILMVAYFKYRKWI